MTKTIRAAVLILLAAVILSVLQPAAVSAADINGWNLIANVDFDAMLGTSTAAGSSVIPEGTLYNKIAVTTSSAKSTDGSFTVMKDEEGAFARMAYSESAKSGGWVSASFSFDSLPIQEYKFKITYRISKNCVSTNSSKTFFMRLRAEKNQDYVILDSDDLENAVASYTDWVTETFTMEATYEPIAARLYGYISPGSYIDIKEVNIYESDYPLFDKFTEFFGDRPRDVIIHFDLRKMADKGISKILDYSNYPEVKELDSSAYVLTNTKLTLKKEFLSTLPNGRKTFVFVVGGISFGSVVSIIHSKAQPAPVSYAKNPASADTTAADTTLDPAVDTTVNPAVDTTAVPAVDTTAVPAVDTTAVPAADTTVDTALDTTSVPVTTEPVDTPEVSTVNTSTSTDSREPAQPEPGMNLPVIIAVVAACVIAAALIVFVILRKRH